MSTNQADLDRLQSAVANSLHAHWRLFLAEGIILFILGILAIVVPPIATIAVEVLIGWLLLMSGIVGLISTFRTRGAPGFGWSLLSAVIGTVAGIVLLAWPLSGALSLTLILTVFLVLEGVVSILYALEHKRELSGRWSMMLFSGVVDLFLAAIIFRHQLGVRRLSPHRDGTARVQHRSGGPFLSSNPGGQSVDALDQRLQQAALGLERGEGQRRAVGFAGLARAPELLQKSPSRRVEQVIVAHLSARR